MDNKTLISALTTSYTRQLASYRILVSLVQKTLSQVILARGDISGLVDVFVQKQRLLDGIMEERAASEPFVREWQKCKADIDPGPEASGLDALLHTMESVIREFLESEEQLKKYLEHAVKKGEKVS